VPHQLKAVAPQVDGRYLRAETQQAALAAAAGIPVSATGTPVTTQEPADA
jgi:NAD(P)H-quinone oxidoreductase subunit K